MTESAQSDQIVKRMIGIGRAIPLPINVMHAQAGRMPTEATHPAIPFDSASVVAIKLPKLLPFCMRLRTGLAENFTRNGPDFPALTAKPLGLEQVVSFLRGDAKDFGAAFTMDLAGNGFSFAASSTKPPCSTSMPPSGFSAASRFGTAFAKDPTRPRGCTVTVGTNALIDKAPILLFGRDQAFLGAGHTAGFARACRGFAAIHTDTLSFEFSIPFLVHSYPPTNIVAQEQGHVK